MGDSIRMNEGPVQRGNGKGGPTTPKPVILPKGQASARTALAEQQKDGPAVQSREPASVVGESIDDAELDELFTEIDGSGEPLSWRAYARAVLSRWGHQPTPPAEGEVAEFTQAAKKPEFPPPRVIREDFLPGKQPFVTDRAAELLQQQEAEIQRLRAQQTPVPVSDSPKPKDCDVEGRCWIHMPDLGTAPSWRLVDPREIGPYHTHWLPATSLPLPQGEVE